MRKKRESIAPDLTPLIDVVFILLIFFIVSSVFKKEELALVLDLPSSQAQALEIKEKEIFIELSSDKLALFGEEVSLEDFDRQLSKIDNKKRTIIYKNMI
jgi:biopolymer transport protein ExbD